MKITGIVSEYNPFHNGHSYQIEKTREAGATHIVAVMSGSFVQRGELAMFSKWERARVALLNGVDLVVELPTPYALSSANRFARGAVGVLSQLQVDSISFGSECGNIDMLCKTAEVATLAQQSQAMSGFLSDGMSYPRAREMAVSILYGSEYARVLANPNNLLGIEYINAMREINSGISPFTVLREQVLHDSNMPSQNMASGSFLRELIKNGEIERIKQFVPLSAYNIYLSEIGKGNAPALQSDIETVVLYKLRCLTREDYARLPDVNEGLENRLYRAGQTATSVEEFYSLVKTKRYTLSKIRRIVCCGLLDITKKEQEIAPRCVRVLGLNQRGMEILANAKGASTVPIEPKFANLYKKVPDAVSFDMMATDIFGLSTPIRRKCGLDFITNTVVIR